MTFVQIIDCKTDKVDEFNRLMDSWAEQTQGRRTATHAVVGADRADSGHIVEIVEFASYEEAMRNSGLPETDRIFREMTALCEEPPTFTDLDVVREEQFNKATARRVFEEFSRGDLSGIDEYVAADYHDHDFANATDIVGRDAIRASAEGWLAAFSFEFTVESQLADGDQVATRWSWRGRHQGDFMGVPASGREMEMTGTTTFRFQDGKIKEGWWHWDMARMMRQLGMQQG
jgi:steroid delta-isomerase-like uncharacterized protein